MSNKNKHPSNFASLSSSNKTPQTQKSLTIAQYSGPLPDPHSLAEYEKLLPGTAKKIIDMAVEQTSHRQVMESKQMDLNTQFQYKLINNFRMGQIFAFTFSILSLLCSTFLIAWGKHIVIGSILGGVTILGVVGAFLYHSSKNIK